MIVELIVVSKHGKMDSAHWTCLFSPHFSVGWAKGLGLHPLMDLPHLSRFLQTFADANINIIFCIFRHKRCSACRPAPPRPHF